ncbi:reverse transcriptase domain-containing protein [Tanacetum coccineum]
MLQREIHLDVRHHIVPIEELNGVSIALVAGSGIVLLGWEVETDIQKRTKNKAKNDKTGHGMEKCISDSPWVSPVHCEPKKGGMTVVENEDNELIPTRYFQIPIDPQDQEKTTFTCPYGTFSYRRMPFGLCNAPGTFQRCMMAIFHDMIEETMEVFMDDLSVFGDSFSSCLSNLDKMLKWCEDTNLVLM